MTMMTMMCLAGRSHVSATDTDDSVFGIGPASRPESPSPSGVAQWSCLIPLDSAGEEAGVVCEAEGEENTGGNGVEGTPNNGMTDEGMTFEKTHKDSSYLEPHVQSRVKCATRKSARVCVR